MAKEKKAKKEKSSKKESSAVSDPTARVSRKERKEKRRITDGGGGDDDAASTLLKHLSGTPASAQVAILAAAPNLLVPFAQPLAGEKATKKILKCVKKGTSSSPPNPHTHARD